MHLDCPLTSPLKSFPHLPHARNLLHVQSYCILSASLPLQFTTQYLRFTANTSSVHSLLNSPHCAYSTLPTLTHTHYTYSSPTHQTHYMAHFTMSTFNPVLVLVLVLFLFNGLSSAFWRMSCSVIQTGRIDPVVSPGKVASHVHKISGAQSKSSSFTSLPRCLVACLHLLRAVSGCCMCLPKLREDKIP